MVSTAENLVRRLKERGWKVAAAESCTAGLVTGAIASVSGASSVLWGGVVTYSGDAKIRLLGIDAKMIDECGQVSRQVSIEMCRKAMQISGAEVGASVTGLAGPLGDGSAVPVGTVFITVMSPFFPEGATYQFRFDGTREEVRAQAVNETLNLLEIVCSSH